MHAHCISGNTQQLMIQIRSVGVSSLFIFLDKLYRNGFNNSYKSFLLHLLIILLYWYLINKHSSLSGCVDSDVSPPLIRLSALTSITHSFIQVTLVLCPLELFHSFNCLLSQRGIVLQLYLRTYKVRFQVNVLMLLIHY